MPEGGENTFDVVFFLVCVLFFYYFLFYFTRNDPDLVQAFLKKWWVESDFKAPDLPLSLRLKVSSHHYDSIYNNT
jgi:hypothetical protein